MTTPRRTGWRPDTHKKPGQKFDLDADEVLASSDPVPRVSSNIELVAGILQQGQLGSCVAHAIAQALRASHLKQGFKDSPLASRLFLYYCSRLYHGEQEFDTGTYLRTCFGALNKFGFPPEASWPYDDGPHLFRRMPRTKAWRDAIDQKSPTVYRRIYSEGRQRVDDVKRALGKGYLVAFGTDVSNDFATDNLSESQVEDPPVGKPLAGGHAMCIVEHTGDRFMIANSWGTDWGQDGFCQFSADYIAWSATRDLWICEHAPAFALAT